MEALLALELDFDRAYAAEKRRRGTVDFRTLSTWRPDSSRRRTARHRSCPELSGRYTEIMVDEYQDVSEVQDLIFRAVSRGGRNLLWWAT